MLEGHEGPVTHVAVTPDSAFGLTAGEDDAIMVWELQSDHPELDAVRFSLHQDDITALVASGPATAEEGGRPRMAFSASRDATARSWNLEHKDQEQDSVELAGHGGPVEALSISGDGDWLLTGSDDQTGRVWDHASPASGGASKVARGHLGEVLAVAVVGAGHRFMSAGADGTTRLWDPRGGRVDAAAVLRGHTGRVKTVAVAPDGRLAATAGEDGVVRLWDLMREDPAGAHRPLSGHKGEVNRVAFDPEGRFLVSIGSDCTARILEAHP